MRPIKLTRRELLHRCAAAGFLTAGSGLLGSVADLFADGESRAAHKLTPLNEIGPFYRKGAPSIAEMQKESDAGFPLRVAGAVFDDRGEARPDATVEIWQADHFGKYDLEGYRYRALLKTDAQGGYAFGSVMPGHYPDRVAQHIHYLVRAPGCRPLITQLYFATDPAFEGDPDRNYGKDPLVLSRELVRPVVLSEEARGPVAQVRFELCLERL